MGLNPVPMKPVEFMGSSREDLSDLPHEVKLTIGHAIYLAQIGGKHADAKPLRGQAFKGAGTPEVVVDFDGNTFRAVYHVKLAGVVYILHVFQKKATKGISTPQHEIDLILERLKQARTHYTTHYFKKTV